MADFIGRLAERAFGEAPVVQPLFSSMFAPKPTDHPMDLTWDGGASTLGGDSDQGQTLPFVEAPLVGDVLQGTHEETAPRFEEQDAFNAVAPASPSRASSASSEPRQRDGSRKPERDVGSGVETRGNLSSAVRQPVRGTPELQPEPFLFSESDSSGRETISREVRQNPPRELNSNPQTLLETRSESLHHDEPYPSRRGASLTSRRTLSERLPSASPVTEDDLDQSVSRAVRTLIGRDHGVTPVSIPPSPGTEATSATNGNKPKDRATSDYSKSLEAGFSAPMTVRPLVDGYPERGPREPRITGSEPLAPTMRVTIGRVEVRAITPPPTPPAQRNTPARPNPALSLDDYLKQRNGGQR